jgi:hypothetical protein
MYCDGVLHVMVYHKVARFAKECVLSLSKNKITSKVGLTNICRNFQIYLVKFFELIKPTISNETILAGFLVSATASLLLRTCPLFNGVN